MQQAVLIFSGVLTALLGVFLIWILARALYARRTGTDTDDGRATEPATPRQDPALPRA